VGRGGKREGAGRKPGSKGVLTVTERALFTQELARRARLLWRLAKQKERETGEPAGPEPSKDDAEASVAMLVSLLLRAAAKGDARATIHLDERLHGRVKFQMSHEGPDGGPISVDQAGPIRMLVEHYDAYQDEGAKTPSRPARPRKDRGPKQGDGRGPGS
jgi:hypothetical protein